MYVNPPDKMVYTDLRAETSRGLVLCQALPGSAVPHLVSPSSHGVVAQHAIQALPGPPTNSLKYQTCKTLGQDVEDTQ